MASSTNPTAPDNTSQLPQTPSRSPKLFSFPPLSSDGTYMASSPPIRGVEAANPSHVSPSSDATMPDSMERSSPQLPPLPTLAEQRGIQQGLSAEDLALACHWADDGITFVVERSTEKLDDLFRGHKDRAHVINTTYHENVEKEGVKLETAMQGLLIQFLHNVKTQIGGQVANAASTSDDTAAQDVSKPAGAIDMAQIEQMFDGMKISILKELEKHQEGMKRMKSNDATKLTRLGDKSTTELMVIQDDVQTALKREIADNFKKTPVVPKQATFHPAADNYAVQAAKLTKRKPSNADKSRASKVLDDAKNMPVTQPTHLQMALGPRIVPRRVASVPKRPVRGIFARPTLTNRTTDIFTRSAPTKTPLPYTEDLIEIKQEDFYVDTAEAMERVETRKRFNESPTKKRRVD